MYALPQPPSQPAALYLIAALGVIVILAFTAVRFGAFRRQAVSPVEESDAAATRKCAYCRRGEAALREETVRLDGDDLVEVRCYVCALCGLPQWWVERRGISPHVH